jgi:hypothetical protein
LLKDSTAIGNINERGGCFIAADNGFWGKSSKGRITLPFDRIGTVYFLGKEDSDAAKAGKDGTKEGEEKAPEAAGTEGGGDKAHEAAGGEGGENKPSETVSEESGENKAPETAGEGSDEQK